MLFSGVYRFGEGEGKKKARAALGQIHSRTDFSHDVVSLVV
jgi:hypothetical protein